MSQRDDSTKENEKILEPLVSVIVPVYNAEKTITTCIKSIIHQTYGNIEVICVNDGSSDSSIAMIRELQREYPIIKLYHQSNNGPSSARNHGIKESRGEFIAFLDSDDEWYPGKLKLTIETFKENPGICIIGSGYSIGDKKDGISTGKLVIIPFKKLLFKNYFLTSGVVCRKSVFDSFSFNEGQKYAEDYRLWLEIAASGNQCAILDFCLLKMNDKPLYGKSGLSAKMWDMEQNEIHNYYTLYKSGHVSFFRLLLVFAFSFMKYMRRIVVSFLVMR